MTLEETIKHAEEVAVEMDESAKAWQKAKDRGNHGWSKSDIENIDSSIIACSKYAAEHRQLAEWLRDYKRLKEQEPCEDAISRQAVIDFINAGHLINPNEPRWSDNEVVNFLKSRPSVKPQEPKVGAL